MNRYSSIRSLIRVASSLVVAAKIEEIECRGADSDRAQELAPAVLELVNGAYAGVGGHVNVRDVHSLFRFDKWFVHLDAQGKPNVAVLANKRRNDSYKVSVLATDSSGEAKAALMTVADDVLKRHGYWSEIPYQYAARLASRGIHMVESEEEVRLLLGRRIDPSFEWYGKHPTKPNLNGAGYYGRAYAGATSIRAIVGNTGDTTERIRKHNSKNLQVAAKLLRIAFGLLPPVLHNP